MIIHRYVSLPVSVYAMTEADNDGNYNVYVNAAISEELRYLAFLHELAHIRRAHFDGGKFVSVCEAEAVHDVDYNKGEIIRWMKHEQILYLGAVG